MTLLLAESWWSLVLRGLLAILLGVIAFTMPAITLGALVILFGVYALTDGIVAIIGAYRASKLHERWGVLLVEGLLRNCRGRGDRHVAGITALTLVLLIGAWALTPEFSRSSQPSNCANTFPASGSFCLVASYPSCSGFWWRSCR